MSRGLELYGAGRLRDAIAEWERALALDPHDREAREYLGYVRTHYDALKSQFQDGSSVPLSGFSLGDEGGESESVPVPTVTAELGGDLDDGWSMGDTDDGDSDTLDRPGSGTLEIGSGLLGELRDLGSVEDGPGATPPREISLGSLIDLEIADAEPVAHDLASVTLPRERPDTVNDPSFDTSDADLPLDIGLAVDEQTLTAKRPAPFGFDDIALPGDSAGAPPRPSAPDPSGDDDEDAPVTVQRPAPFDFGDLALAGDDEDSSVTVQRRSPIDFGDIALAGDEPQAPTLELDGPLPASEAATATHELRVPTQGGQGSVAEALRSEISTALDRGAPPGESADDAIHRRVSGLIKRAVQERGAGRGQIAVVAAAMALDEAPASVVAQKLIHESKTELQAVFAAYIGSLDMVPVLVKPLHEIAGIDSRDAFLLSQVDGLLSLGDIIDVSGMPSLDAYRLLCRLLVDGIIHLG